MTTKQEALEHLIEVGEILRDKLYERGIHDRGLRVWADSWDDARKDYEEAE